MSAERIPHDVQPEWVLVDGDRHHVSDFAHLRPMDRPPAFCPVCDRQVILKLGQVRVHHYAHHPGNICAVTQPETALHLNVKLHLARELEQQLPLIVLQPCTAPFGLCDNTREVELVAGWEHVHVEYTVDPYRPDIALVRGGIVIGAVEVLVTHATTPEKAEYLQQEEIRWAEVEGMETLYTGDAPWEAGEPLPVVRFWPDDDWTCPECQILLEEEAAREERRREERERLAKVVEERRRQKERNPDPVIHAAKMVDFYYPSGKKYRELFFLKYRKLPNGKIEAWAERENWKKVGKVFTTTRLTKSLLQRVARQVSELIRTLTKNPDAFVDEVISWQKWVKGKKFHPLDDRYPQRYQWDGERWHKPEPPPFPSLPERPERQRLKPRKSYTSSQHYQSLQREQPVKRLDDLKPVCTCIYCGAKTRDYWRWNNQTKMCRCRPCRAAGRV